MQSISGSIRDLVGILFPGGFLVVLGLWFVVGIMMFFIPSDFIKIVSTLNNWPFFSLLVIISYIAGLFLRMKQLGDLENKCSQKYREKKIKESKKENQSPITNEEFEKSVQNLKDATDKYFSGKLSLEKIREQYIEHRERFGIWEDFPYPYYSKADSFLRQSDKYNEFFEKYYKQGIMKYRTFFNFCKSAIIEYSSSLKEEVLRQESLLRLFSGIYYAIRYGKRISIIVGSLHLISMIAYHLKIEFVPHSDLGNSYLIIIFSLLAVLIFLFMNREILSRVRYMRYKEIELVYSGFYIICKKNKLDQEFI